MKLDAWALVFVALCPLRAWSFSLRLPRSGVRLVCDERKLCRRKVSEIGSDFGESPSFSDVERPMAFTSYMSTLSTLNDALAEAMEGCLRGLKGEASSSSSEDSSDGVDCGASVDLCLLSFSSSYQRVVDYPLLVQQVLDIAASRGVAVRNVMGSTARGVLGEGRSSLEQEDEPALTMTMARLPSVKLAPFSISEDDLPDANQVLDREALDRIQSKLSGASSARGRR